MFPLRFHSFHTIFLLGAPAAFSRHRMAPPDGTVAVVTHGTVISLLARAGDPKGPF